MRPRGELWHSGAMSADMPRPDPLPDAPPATRPGRGTPRVAVLVPCLDEEATVARVVAGFRAALPGATVHVYDNGSADGTLAAARGAGAAVGTEPRRGKGNVIRRMFSDIEADIYILVDGDETYDPAVAARIVETMRARGLDFMNVAREPEPGAAYRPGHALGNRVLSGLVRRVFGTGIADMLSGYKAFSRRYVKSFPALSRGFEIETELTVHALELRMPMAEIAAPYRARPRGSASKLGTLRDGWRILATIFSLIRDERPLPFFAAIGGLLILGAIVLMIPVFETWVETGEVPRFPTAILASAMTLAGLLSLSVGLVLDTVTRGRQEMKRMFYLMHAPPAGAPREGEPQPGATRAADPAEAPPGR